MSEFLQTLLRTAREEPTRGWLETKAPNGAFVRRTWSQVHDDARRVAEGLRERGVVRGDAVALFMGSPADVAVAVQASWLIGASVTMLHQPTARTNLTTYAEQTVGVLRMIDARALILGDPYVDLAQHFEPAVDRLRARLVLMADLVATTQSIDVDAQIADEDDIALLQLTSGSTAAPKAVTITHRSLIANMRAMAIASEITDDDIMVSWLPTFHDMGMVGFLSVPMVFGFRLVKVTPADFVTSPTSWMRLISEHSATITAAPNFAYGVAARSLQKATDLDLSSLRIALNGAEPIDAATVEAFCDAGAPHGLRPIAMLCAYGMAEAALAVSFAPLNTGLVLDKVDERALSERRVAEPVDRDSGSAFALLGHPLSGIEVEVRAEDGAICPERHVGRLAIRGTAVTSGYLTAEGYLPARDDDGWLDTGDEGYLCDGQVVVCGRVKDLIILAGRNIFPTDIERAVERIPGIRRGNSAAVSLPSGGRETVVVIAESLYHDDAEHAQRIAHEVRMAAYADLEVRVSKVVLIAPGTLPKTPSGKIQRARVRAELLRQSGNADASA
ncbi:MAG: fatty acyl-AMP ligase [Cumulibacter sp.]